jgi:hypothetical protein
MTRDDKSRHDFKNQLAIVLGFSEILLAEAAEDDPRRGDFKEIHTAAIAAMDLLADLYRDAAPETPVSGICANPTTERL